MAQKLGTLTIGKLLNMHNVLPLKELNDRDLTSCMALDEIKTWMVSREKRAAYITIHSSNINSLADPRIASVEYLQKKYGIGCQIVNLHPVSVSVSALENCFENKFFLQRYHQSIPLRGDNIVFFILDDSVDEAFKNGPELVQRITSAIRLCHGVSAVGQSRYSCVYDVIDDSCTAYSDYFTLLAEEMGEGKDISATCRFDANFTLFDFPLKPDAEVLFNRALAENSPHTRFLFFWLCFESIIGKARSRRDFFLGKLGSTIIDEEVGRLADVRNDLAHEGKFTATSRDTTSLLWALRLVLFAQNGAFRNAVHEYEQWISAAP